MTVIVDSSASEEVIIRPIHPTDGPALRRFHDGLSERTVYLRFFVVHPHLTDAQVDHFTIVDHASREALVVQSGEDIVRSRGAVPATIAILDGRVRIGLDGDALNQVAHRDDITKVSTRDLATLVAQGGSGATTVAATSHLAHAVGIPIFATGGLGGVHRHARESWDEPI